MDKKNGFTLIEIMVVIVIMGILAAVGVPKLFGMIAKAKTTELLSAAGTYIHLEDAYLHQERGVGSWKDIGYTAPGNGKTSNFEYGDCQQDESSSESGNSFIGWHATSRPQRMPHRQRLGYCHHTRQSANRILFPNSLFSGMRDLL